MRGPGAAGRIPARSRRVLGRLLELIFVLWFVATLVFVLLRVLPGDPALLLLGIDALNPDALARAQAEMGLDRPLVVQYGLWLFNLVQGDLGTSLRSGIEVGELVAGALPVTLELALLAMLIGVALSLLAGISAARRRGRPADLSIVAAALAGISLPHFVLAMLLIYLFSLNLNLLPTGGYVSFFEDPIENLRRMALPALTLGLVTAGILTRMMRRSMIDEMGLDYVRTARAKGAGEGRVHYDHALKNAVVPYLTIAGIEAGTLLSGAVIVETVFALPGLGRLMIENINLRDYTVVQGAVFTIAFFYVAVNQGVDLLYARLDPRVRTS